MCLSLCSRKRLRARLNLVRYLIPLELWQLKSNLQQILFEDSFLRLAAVRRLGSGLFHSITVDGKK